jgi:hypothetical protein
MPESTTIFVDQLDQLHKDQMLQQQAVEAGLRKAITEGEQAAGVLRQEKHAIELQLSSGLAPLYFSYSSASQELSHTLKEREAQDKEISKLKQAKESTKNQLRVSSRS